MSSEEEYEKTEKLLNAHMQVLSRVLCFDKRVAQSFITENNEIPPLYGLRKDHKEIPEGEEEKGPPQRPVCGAVVASNYRLSHFVSTILQPVIQLEKYNCNSTEDLLGRVRKVNGEMDLKNCIIGSMDVKALYPSIDIDFAVQKCVEMIKESKVSFEKVDTEELGLYISLNMSIEEIKRLEIEDFCAKRKRAGKKPTITGCGMKDSKEERWECWRKPKCTPEGDEVKRMISEALGIAMKTILKNHIFRFNDEIRKQATGGAIGVKAAGDIASLFMCWWDKEFLRRVNELLKELNLYLRYVDDEYVICEVIPENERNKDQERDERTMKELQRIGNGIHPSIQVTVDYPSNNTNGRMPVLDTEHWLEEMEVNGTKRTQVIHSHYSKPMANPYVIHKNSAISDRSKFNILTADLVRVMRNVSTQCTTAEKNSKIQFYISRMQYSGYNAEERINIYRAAKKKYIEMLRKDTEGITPLYREKNWNRIERIREKEIKKRSWYKKGKEEAEAVFYVKATPNSKLAEECKKEFKKANLKVKVIEKTGRSIKSNIVKSNPFKKIGCAKKCPVCEKGIDCKARGVHYRIRCGETGCEDAQYEGETARSTGERFPEHLRLIGDKREQWRQKSAFYEHAWERHEGAIPPLEFEIIGKYPGDPGLRQAMEAVSIRVNKPRMNGKREWTNEPRPRKTEETGRTGTTGPTNRRGASNNSDTGVNRRSTGTTGTTGPNNRRGASNSSDTGVNRRSTSRTSRTGPSNSRGASNNSDAGVNRRSTGRTGTTGPNNRRGASNSSNTGVNRRSMSDSRPPQATIVTSNRH